MRSVIAKQRKVGLVLIGISERAFRGLAPVAKLITLALRQAIKVCRRIPAFHYLAMDQLHEVLVDDVASYLRTFGGKLLNLAGSELQNAYVKRTSTPVENHHKATVFHFVPAANQCRG